ncbi:hypothetical protein OJF2_72430 [Aquisphaera giovannonii]|uniref:Uncharacterized protein n=1 Tax=Aquisphaera giovannonii TaxID=406548 RepID=A0A5B9WDP8_9BACT|nr:hypothetical protein [Aquisphaera giovannonii]QEH38637.1 hypothetical protein OJF2_72430 [Aquisphaera giovannonii]
MIDGRILRDRQADTLALVDKLSAPPQVGSVAVLAQTKAVATYPGVASAFFACAPIEVDGPETEGAAATFTADASRTIYALNLGTRLPPLGTKVILHACGGRWTFRFDG